MSNEELYAFIKNAFKGKEEALLFVLLHGEYCHALDDIVDGAKLDAEHVLNTFRLANLLFSSTYYIRNYPALSTIIDNIANAYADSVLWEKADEEWKRNHADVLRHAGYDLFFAVINIELGYEMMRKISPLFREYSHKHHLNDIINYEKQNETAKEAASVG